MKERQPLNSSGIFYDSANLTDFRKWFDTGILGGATTNPLILQKEGILDIPGHISKMIEISGRNFPISIEVPDSEMPKEDMIELALKYQKRFPGNAVIKIPMDPRDPQKAFEVIYKLGQEGVRVNATLGVSVGQLIGASEAIRQSRADGENYISLFWGRREEAKKMIVETMVKNGMTEEEAAQKVPDAAASLVMVLEYLKTHSLATRVIVGSVRSVDQIEKAFLLGVDIVTIPPKLIQEWMYTQRGVETAEQFNQAYRSVKDKITLI
ncbi:MAG: hypothetical protein NT162_02580 [Candidatus Woesebacteria bacterium]|nr:hypothetical protein [Candidatus Woesebacteria bacterium]